MDLTKWGVPANTNAEEETKLHEELKRLRVVADMAAAMMQDMDEFLADKYSDSVVRKISRAEYENYERKNKNINLALKFAGYNNIDKRTGALIKGEPKPTKVVKLPRSA